MPAVIHFKASAYSSAGQKLMGRHVAGKSFLRALAHYGTGTELWAQVATPEDAGAFTTALKSWNSPLSPRVAGLLDPDVLRRVGTQFRPEPRLVPSAWNRAPFGSRSWSICGVTHTTASAGIMDSVTELLTGPIEPWDAVICTSQAVRANVMELVDGQARYLKSRFGIGSFTCRNCR